MSTPDASHHPSYTPESLPAEEAIPNLLDEHGGRIYHLGLRICGGPDLAEDLVQETFLNAFRKWESFEGRAEPSTWLYTIAARVCQRMKRLRAGEPQRMETLDDLLPGPDDAVPALGDPHDEMVRREAESKVQEAIATLPLDFRLPLVMKDIVELPLVAIAEILGVKEATIKTRVHRARLKLRQALVDDLPRQEDASDSEAERRLCLDLLWAKQQALDKGVDFDMPDQELCQRCLTLLASLDLAHDACLAIGRGDLPAPLRDALRREMGVDP
ncbi:MAG: RNA polymerase sigma factor [Acidobacteriota bacterium]